MKTDPTSPATGPGGGAFPTTQWSMVLHAGADTDTRAQAALEQLCGRYWYPLYVYVRRQGRPHHEAEDCTQEFLARLLAADGLARARREHGRFRTYLLTALQHFLINDWQRTQAAKRGGGREVLPLGVPDADERFAREPADGALTPDQAFDRSWVQGMIAGAAAALRAEYERSGRGALFEALGPLLWSNPRAEDIAGPAARLGLTAHAFTMALHRLRRRLGERLRADVAETVADGADLDAELRHLIAAVGGRAAGG